MRRVGVFGGTFDPPHLGHLMLAETAREKLRLDRVVFMPAGTPPHKHRRDLSPAERRIDMTRLAVRGHPQFEVSTLEARRVGPSYTVDTLGALHRRAPDARLYLLMGGDSLDDFSTWHDPQRILELATLVAHPRPGARGARRSRAGVLWLNGPELDVSSSMIRARLRAGASVRYLLPDAVERYARRHRLYRPRRG
jgi:nicotinate-nucleotide adenylyltransferase